MLISFYFQSYTIHIDKLSYSFYHMYNVGTHKHYNTLIVQSVTYVRVCMYTHITHMQCFLLHQSPICSVVEHQTFNLRVMGSNSILGLFSILLYDTTTPTLI